MLKIYFILLIIRTKLQEQTKGQIENLCNFGLMKLGTGVIGNYLFNKLVREYVEGHVSGRPNFLNNTIKINDLPGVLITRCDM